MSLLEIVILSAVVLSIFSLGSFFLQHHRKAGNKDGYTYWFENVDELM